MALVAAMAIGHRDLQDTGATLEAWLVGALSPQRLAGAIVIGLRGHPTGVMSTLYPQSRLGITALVGSLVVVGFLNLQTEATPS